MYLGIYPYIGRGAEWVTSLTSDGVLDRAHVLLVKGCV